ncbi:preprotein translocase subunit SecG [Candidatus Giovannonibacteria bacterium]|nr:preprotein translocase subunit SecG [Candidatus Giovannonibacteria bacterium]
MSSLVLALPYFQVVVSILLIVAVLLQQRGSGLSSTFGGEGGGAYQTKRGLEKILFVATIVLGALFILTALLNLILQ